MTTEQQHVTGGVDTHGDTHHAAVVDSVGRHLGDREVPATASGYRRLMAWVSSFGRVQRIVWKAPEPTARR